MASRSASTDGVHVLGPADHPQLGHRLGRRHHQLQARPPAADQPCPRMRVVGAARHRRWPGSRPGRPRRPGRADRGPGRPRPSVSPPGRRSRRPPRSPGRRPGRPRCARGTRPSPPPSSASTPFPPPGPPAVPNRRLQTCSKCFGCYIRCVGSSGVVLVEGAVTVSNGQMVMWVWGVGRTVESWVRRCGGSRGSCGCWEIFL